MKKQLVLSYLTAIIVGCSSITESDFSNGGETGSSVAPLPTTHQGDASSDHWITAYLASYAHYVPPDNQGSMPTDAIDWDAFTHLTYFSLTAQPDGSLSGIAYGNTMKPNEVREIVSTGHQNGVPVLICIGGWGNYNGFSQAIRSGSRSNFVNNIINIVREWGFDGVDVNMEPIQSADWNNYITFVNELYNRLQSLQTPMLSKPLMTAAVHWKPDLISRVQDKFDQINIMTYNLSGAWTGWVTWHNSPLNNDNGYKFPGYETTLPSVNKDIDEYMGAGIPAQKLGMGIDFYGYVWSGVSQPKEEWNDNNPPHVEAEVPYSRIMNQYYQPGYYRWDESAQASYLSIEEWGRKQFVSYDDERSIQVKFDLLRQRNLGGVIIWELGGGYRSDQPYGERDNLLQAIKESSGIVGNNKTGSADTTPPSITILSPAEGSRVSGTVTIEAEVSDQNTIDNVAFFVDGGKLGDAQGPSPYRLSWQSAQTRDGEHTLMAMATDAAGNQNASSVKIQVQNQSTDSTSYTIYEESLDNGWINASWNADINLTSTEQKYAGTNSIKIIQSSWGALSLRSGNWGASEDVNTGQYGSLQFAVWPEGQNLNMRIYFQNDENASFQKVALGSLASGQWNRVSVPVSELNPDNIPVNRLNIQETSGQTKTFFIDQMGFTVQ